MIETRFSTVGLPKADRWPSWYDFGNKSHIPTLIRTDHADDFQGSVTLLHLGPVQVSTLTYSPLHVVRTAKSIRQSDPGVYFLVAHLRGRIGMAQSGREVSLGPRDLVLYDTSRPFQSWASAGRGEVAGCIVVQIPRALLPIRAESLDPLLAVRLPGQEGISGLLGHHLVALTRDPTGYTAADATRLAGITLDLLAAVCAHQLEAVHTLPSATRQQAMQIQIHSFITQRLGDPELSPETIATAHGISTRYLHKLFHEQGLTVAGWIRQRRLEHCRRDLADPGQRHRPVHAIANRWGFTSGAHFSRLFRTRYDLAPSDYRRLAADLDSGAQQ